MLPSYFHTDSPWVWEVTKPLKARYGSVRKECECRNYWRCQSIRDIWTHIERHFFDSKDLKKQNKTKNTMGQNQALGDIKLSWKVKKKRFFFFPQILWFLTNEMPVFILHISSFHLSNVKSEQEKEKIAKHNIVPEKRIEKLNK